MDLRRKIGSLALVALSATLCTGHAFAWSPKKAAIMTKFAAQVDPEKTLPEYPRPQLTRPDWLNLNGVWQLKRGGAEGDATPTGAKLPDEILVPFPVESALSGVMEHSDRLWYRRMFTVPAAWSGKRIMLHFGAVDWESEVYVNGKSLGVHKGGYDPFTYDVTDALKGSGEQELIVRVYDPTDDKGQPRGKQSLYPGGIMYTPCTGIWQTVWLEPVAQGGIKNLKIVPDVDKGALRLTVNSLNPAAGATVSVKVKGDGGAAVASVEGQKLNTEIVIPVANAKLWSPDSPFLYDLEVSVNSGGAVIDKVGSYFGMRKIEIAEENGVKKMFLNGKFLWNYGPLDQGFWPDGIYTQPTEEALKYDLEMTKAFGFNMIRKHIKVEPARWYYWTDKMGIVVWQDMPSTNSYIDTGKRKVPPIDKEAYERELKAMIENLYNVPSIIMWEPYNEGQGQYDTPRIVSLIKSLDPTRLVNEASGGGYSGSGDVHDIHAYPPPDCPPPNSKQAIACGEFGGIGFNVPGHTWTGKGGGYTDVHDSTDLVELYADFCNRLKGFRDKRGLSAAVYTQTTDVETEINGLMTYDRIPKADPALIRKATTFQYVLPTYKPVVPTSEESAQAWKYTTDKPADGWTQPGFNDLPWKDGKGGFGDVPGTKGHTEWKTSDIWLRRHFNPGALSELDLTRLMLRLFNDEDVQVYINGVLAFERRGFVTSYDYKNIRGEAKKALKPGADNIMAIHCSQTEGGQFIDAGLSVKIPAAQ